MFLGAYWSPRSCSREAAAAQITDFLRRLAENTPQLSNWFAKKPNRGAPDGAPLTEAGIRQMLHVNRRDTDDSAIPDLGFNLGLWNGERVSLRMTLGAANPNVSNCVVITETGDSRIADSEWKTAVSLVIEVFDPEHAVVAHPSVQRQHNVRHPWDAGWLVYEKGRGLEEYSEYR
jgi:hypothetical protein